MPDKNQPAQRWETSLQIDSPARHSSCTHTFNTYVSQYTANSTLKEITSIQKLMQIDKAKMSSEL